MWRNKEELESKIGKIEEMIDKIQAIYEEANGEPNPKPQINCFVCDRPTTNYACAWEINKHVHFHCEHCGAHFMM